MKGTITWESIQKLVDELKPPPDMELIYCASTATLPKFLAVKEKNKGPFGKDLIPMREVDFMPHGFVCLLTYHQYERYRLADESKIFDLR